MGLQLTNLLPMCRDVDQGSILVRRDLQYHEINTAGSISLHINSNKEGDGGRNDHWMDYNVGW